MTYTSDYFPQMIEIAEKMIAAGNLYADNTDVDTMRDERLKRMESVCRSQDKEVTARIFDQMLAGSDVRLHLACAHPLAVSHCMPSTFCIT